MYVFSAVEQCGSSGELRRTTGLLCTPSSDEAFPSFCCLFLMIQEQKKSSDLENIGISFYCKIFTISSFSETNSAKCGLETAKPVNSFVSYIF